METYNIFKSRVLEIKPTSDAEANIQHHLLEYLKEFGVEGQQHYWTDPDGVNSKASNFLSTFDDEVYDEQFTDENTDKPFDETDLENFITKYLPDHSPYVRNAEEGYPAPNQGI